VNYTIWSCSSKFSSPFFYKSNFLEVLGPITLFVATADGLARGFILASTVLLLSFTLIIFHRLTLRVNKSLSPASGTFQEFS
jgi:hypothetical protein